MTQFEKMKAQLGLAPDASDEDVAAAVAALQSKADNAGGANAVAALEARVDAKFNSLTATLQGIVEAFQGNKQEPVADAIASDDGKSIADVDLVLGLKQKIANLEKDAAERKAEERRGTVESLISTAINEGRVLEAERKMLTKMGLSSDTGIQDLKAYLDECRSISIPALMGTQTAGNLSFAGDDVLSPYERQMAAQVDPAIAAEMRRLKSANNRQMAGGVK